MGERLRAGSTDRESLLPSLEILVRLANGSFKEGMWGDVRVLGRGSLWIVSFLMFEFEGEVQEERRGGSTQISHTQATRAQV